MLEGKRPKLYFMTQVGTRPPSFVIKANTDRGLHFSYMRYLENRLREAFGFIGTPIRLSVQKKQAGDEAPADAAKVRQVIDPGIGLKPSRAREGGGTAARRAPRRPGARGRLEEVQEGASLPPPPDKPRKTPAKAKPRKAVEKARPPAKKVHLKKKDGPPAHKPRQKSLKRS
jgi:GTP-binding protein